MKPTEDDGTQSQRKQSSMSETAPAALPAPSPRPLKPAAEDTTQSRQSAPGLKESKFLTKVSFSESPEGTTTGTGSSGTKRHRKSKNQQSLTSVSALPVPLPLKSATGDTTQTPRQAGSINAGTGPAVPQVPPPSLRGLLNTPLPPPSEKKKGAGGDPQSTPLPPSPAPTSASKSGPTYPQVPPPPLTIRGLPNTPGPPPVSVKKAAGGDPQSTPLPPSPAPAPARKSGTTYLTTAQEKAQLAALQAGALNPPQPTRGKATQVLEASKTAQIGDAFDDIRGSLFLPPYGMRYVTDRAFYQASDLDI
ncbi:hypothetical protein FRC00_008440 [Tulasnella sp. 408]|nr:hypothetical protein FRC00_008440 [Tulasnella sp. 408]